MGWVRSAIFLHKDANGLQSNQLSGSNLRSLGFQVPTLPVGGKSYFAKSPLWQKTPLCIVCSRDSDSLDLKAPPNRSRPAQENLPNPMNLALHRKKGSPTYFHGILQSNFFWNKTKYTMDPRIYFLMTTNTDDTKKCPLIIRIMSPNYLNYVKI